MESYENNGQNTSAETALPTRREARVAPATETKRITIPLTEELFEALSIEHDAADEKALAEAIRLGFYKAHGLARPATRAELKLRENIAKLQAKLAASEAN